MKKVMCTAVMLCFMVVGAYAQSVALAFGDLKWLSGEKTLQFEFSYEDMQVGKMSEADFV